ncbi:MAG TPA: hypothetical protein VJL34_06190 [Anaerolineales bacterium]|nr:hypothetical protein [Anaerolineales bacterium]
MSDGWGESGMCADGKPKVSGSKYAVAGASVMSGGVFGAMGTTSVDWIPAGDG